MRRLSRGDCKPMRSHVSPSPAKERQSRSRIRWSCSRASRSGTKELRPEINRKLTEDGIGLMPGTRANSRCIHAPWLAVQRWTRLHQRLYRPGRPSHCSVSAEAIPFTGQGSLHVLQRLRRSGWAISASRAIIFPARFRAGQSNIKCLKRRASPR